MTNELSQQKYIDKLKNKDFTIIARDCIGGVLYHQLKMKFLTPTINLFLTPEDFNYFVLYLKDYIDGEMVESKNEEVDYPVGILSPNADSSVKKPIKIHFMHYDNFKNALDKWNERKKRINYDNLYVISSFCYPTEVPLLNDKLIEDWNKIPYKKVVLVDKKYGFDDEYIVKKNKNCKEFAWLLYQPSEKLTWKRTFNDFDFIKFLNKQ